MKLYQLAIVSLTLWAGQVAADDNWFQVEVIVFTQEDPQREEAPRTAPQLAFPSDLRILEPAPRVQSRLPAPDELNRRLAALMVPEALLTRERARAKKAFTPLDEDQRQLNPEAYTLGRSGHYRVLFHEAWRQPATKRGTAPWVLLRGGRERAGTPEMAGALRIFQERFYHVEATLWWATEMSPTREDANGIDTAATEENRSVVLPRPPEPEPSPAMQRLERMDRAAARDESVEDRQAPESERAPVTAPAVDLLQRSEQIRPEKRHYLDHPRLGVLVLVTPMEEDDGKKEKTVPRTPIPLNP